MADTSSLKQLRVMSGAHAGACLDLDPGRHTIGRSDDCDISISDWGLETLVLEIGANRKVHAQWLSTESAGPPLDDFRPIDFAGVVVCVGPCHAGWPDDAALLAALRPATARAPLTLPRRVAFASRGRLISGAAAVTVAAIGSVWLASAKSTPREADFTLASERVVLQHTLDGVAANRLAVSMTPTSLVVDGLVDSPEQARAVTEAIDAVPRRYAVLRHVSVATSVAESIRGALGLPGVQVTYKGKRVFEVAVASTDVDATKAAVNRVADDLAPLVRRIDTVIQETPEPPLPTPAMLSLMVADGVSVMETRDHVKHLVLNDALVAPGHPDPSDPPASEAELASYAAAAPNH